MTVAKPFVMPEVKEPLEVSLTPETTDALSEPSFPDAQSDRTIYQAEKPVSVNALKVELVRAFIVLVAVITTGVISINNPTFAENQAGIILSATVGGYFGLSSSKR